jgi:hypothetical protein
MDRRFEKTLCFLRYGYDFEVLADLDPLEHHGDARNHLRLRCIRSLRKPAKALLIREFPAESGRQWIGITRCRFDTLARWPRL